MDTRTTDEKINDIGKLTSIILVVAVLGMAASILTYAKLK